MECIICGVLMRNWIYIIIQFYMLHMYVIDSFLENLNWNVLMIPLGWLVLNGKCSFFWTLMYIKPNKKNDIGYIHKQTEV